MGKLTMSFFPFVICAFPYPIISIHMWYKYSFVYLLTPTNIHIFIRFLFFKVEGAITVQPLAEEVRGFRDYFFSLRPATNTRNPWWVEYWEQFFSCKYPGSTVTPFNRVSPSEQCSQLSRLFSVHFRSNFPSNTSFEHEDNFENNAHNPEGISQALRSISTFSKIASFIKMNIPT